MKNLNKNQHSTAKFLVEILTSALSTTGSVHGICGVVHNLSSSEKFHSKKMSTEDITHPCSFFIL